MSRHLMTNGMKYIKHENKIQLVHTNISSMEMISSVLFHVQNHIMSRFPKKLFKSVRIDTATAASLQSDNLVNGNDIQKVEYPSVTISPRISLDEPFSGADMNPHMASPNLYMMKDLQGFYRKILHAPKNAFTVYDTYMPITSVFNFKIATKSFEQNGNMLYHIKNSLATDRTLFLHKMPIQTELPKKFVKIMAKLQKEAYDTELTMDDIVYLISSLTTTSGNIYKKLNTMTGKYSLFMDDYADILFSVRNLNAPETIVRNNMTEGEYIIEFDVQATVNVTNNFIMNIDYNKFKAVADDDSLANELFEDESDESVNMLSLYSPIRFKADESLFFKDSLGEQHIGQLLVSEVLSGSDDEVKGSVPYVINLEQFMRKDVLQIHSFMNIMNLDIKSLLHIEIYCRNEADKDFVEVDYDLLTIKFNRVADDIMFAVYFDRSVYDYVYGKKLSGSFNFSNNFLTTFKFCSNEGTNEKPNFVNYDIIVKSFESKEDMSSDDLDKCLRVNTIYGEGYLYVVDEDHELASELKVCVGTDKKGNKLIKSLVLLKIE